MADPFYSGDPTQPMPHAFAPSKTNLQNNNGVLRQLIALANPNAPAQEPPVPDLPFDPATFIPHGWVQRSIDYPLLFELDEPAARQIIYFNMAIPAAIRSSFLSAYLPDLFNLTHARSYSSWKAMANAAASLRPIPLENGDILEQIATLKWLLVLATLSENVYTDATLPANIQNQGWTRVEFDFDTKTGFQWAVFRNELTGHVVLAFAGTSDKADWRANFTNGFHLLAEQYLQAWRLGLAVQLRYGNSVIVTGHSLGGGEGAFVSAAHGFPAVTYNAAGVAKEVLALVGATPDDLLGRVLAVTVRDEILDSVQTPGFEELARSAIFAPGTYFLGREIPDRNGLRFEIDGNPQTLDTISLHGLTNVMFGLNALVNELRQKLLDMGY